MAGRPGDRLREEDEVRDEARDILGLTDGPGYRAGTGQVTTFNSLGFPGVLYKPDGWYLPDNASDPALVLEAKSERQADFKKSHIDELLRNCDVVAGKYKNVVGVLYNGSKVVAFKNGEQFAVAETLQAKEYYLSVFAEGAFERERIYMLTKRINDSLHYNFGINNLYHRMIFAACALVAERYGAGLADLKGKGYAPFHTMILSVLNKSLQEDIRQNDKISILTEVYGDIKMNYAENQAAIDDFIDWVCEIGECIKSQKWHGEDVMGIFFNEFNRYKSKSESGQVLTPDHVTSLLYRIADVKKGDRVLDAACGTGAFLTKSMYNMIGEAGGLLTSEAGDIMDGQIFGVEYDKQVFALACANMLIHKDGKTNLYWGDSRTEDVAKWIRKKKITKVLMNPPFENKHGCLKIVENVLDNVQRHATCAFIMPDKKLEKAKKGTSRRILKNHSLLKVIKLPEATFAGVGMPASVYVFEAGVPQDGKDIFTCYIEDDGLVAVKNQGRHDVYGRWPAIEEEWVEIIRRQSGHDTVKWVDPAEHLSYQTPEPPFELFEEDFRRTLTDFALFQRGVDAKDFTTRLTSRVLYSSTVFEGDGVVSISVPVDGGDDAQD